MRLVDLDLLPLLDPERRRSLVGADREQLVDPEDVATARLPARDSVELA